MCNICELASYLDEESSVRTVSSVFDEESPQLDSNPGDEKKKPVLVLR